MSTCHLCLRGFRTATLNLQTARAFSTFSPARTVQPAASPSFATLGLPPLLLQALQVAFPHIQAATPCQAALLQALIPVQPSKRLSQRRAQTGEDGDSGSSASGRSLILRDVTGSGKSLALLLGMLARSHHAHEQSAKARSSSKRRKAKVEQLLLVPHTEIARQMEYWVELLRSAVAHPAQDAIPDQVALAAADRMSVTTAMQSDATPTTEELPFSGAQVLYRGLVEPLALSESTDLLIATPSALLEVLASLSSEDVRIIALDEADNMLKLPNRFSTHKEMEKWERHPPAVMGIMEELLALLTSRKRSSPSRRGPALRESERMSSRRAGSTVSDQDEHVDGDNPGKRIIAVSATANSVFRDWMVRRSGWVKLKGELGERQVDWYDFSAAEEPEAHNLAGDGQLSVYKKAGQTLLPKAEVEHLLYRVSSKGELLGDTDGMVAEAEEPSASSPAAGRGTPPNLEPFVLAASTLFAVEQLTSALMLIPSGTSLPKTLDYLHSLDMPATTLAEARGLKLPADEPRLYVVAADAVRGLDIPQLSHVFILPGTVQDSAAYLHTSGRVGRLVGGDGKRMAGKVVSLVSTQTPTAATQREETRIRRFWELLGIDGKLGEAPHLE